MFGYLKIFVLRELEKRDMAGYDIMKSFESFTGGKMPSPGTIYPLLNELLRKKLIKVTLNGKKKVYSMTKKGEILLQSLMNERKKVLKNMVPLLSTVYNKEELAKIKAHLGIVAARFPLHRDFDVVKGLKESIFKFLGSKAYSTRRQEFRRIISEASANVRRLR